ncbi:YybH family protein [Streptomyces sp. NRRL F-5123]|uniref:YybH family protein n=1 Tax=Streptomyces sp. NRRL F-5123 TaxID=1463856 RepID=UPI0006933487|nr:SgcJ/EcaC family oxidoreductase [Streptomyces sp. NRRL F-5123]
MAEAPAELTAFLRRYEQAANSHDVDRVMPLIAEDAVYWFTDGSHRGRAEIAGALARTFAAIREETYEISDVEWVVLAPAHAVCRYRFRWTGVVGGRTRSGTGRGTNVVVRRDGGWKMLHEHLSS